MTHQTILALRLERQCLTAPVSDGDYDALFCDLSPVLCEYWSRPGDPPRLFQRSLDQDFPYNDHRRSRREILKGRFHHGIAYVERADLQLYGCLYRKESSLPAEAFQILDLLEREGPLTANQLREITGLGKQVATALQKLQEAFLIFEDQVDCDWDRGFYSFSAEFPDIDWTTYTKVEALTAALPRFFRRMVWATAEDAKSWFNRPAKEVQAALDALAAAGTLAVVEGGYILAEDLPLLGEERSVPGGIFALHRNDFLVKSWTHRLKGKYAHEEHQVLYYLLIDGEIGGAVLGRFSNKVNELVLPVFDHPANEDRTQELRAALAQVTKAPPLF